MLDIRHANIFTHSLTMIGTATNTIRTPKNICREFLHGRFELNTDATVATRNVYIDMYDSADVQVGRWLWGPDRAASGSQYIYYHPLSSSTYVIYPPCIIPAGYYIKILINNGAAGDSLKATFVFADYLMTAKDDKSSSRRRT